MLGEDLRNLRSHVDYAALLALPNVRRVRELLAVTQAAHEGYSPAAVGGLLAPQQHSAAAAAAGGATARFVRRSGDPLAEPPQASQPLPRGGGAQPGRGAPTARGDPDRWFKLLWWLLRSVRADFSPWHAGAAASPKEAQQVAEASSAVARDARAGGRRFALYCVRPHTGFRARAPVAPAAAARALGDGGGGWMLPGHPGHPPLALADAAVVAATQARAAALPSPLSLGMAFTEPMFHGSPTPAWGSILRNGLVSLSNTRHMRFGAARGAGIYLARDCGTSLAYTCGLRAGWPGRGGSPSAATDGTACALALVAVAPTPPGLDGATWGMTADSSGVRVVQDPSKLEVTHLFVSARQ